MTKDRFFITIGRQVGAGGLEVAGKLSKIFGIPVYDKELLSKASNDSGICKEFFENADETQLSSAGSGSGLFGLGLSSVEFNAFYTTSPLSGCNLFTMQCNAIREIANEQSAIFVGRCADYVLRDEPNTISLFISANEADRISRLRLSKSLKGIAEMSDSQIIDYMKKVDKKRASYYNYYSYKQWGSALSYDICLNSSLLGTDYCAEMVAEFVNKKIRG